MIRFDAQALRESWKQRGNPPCEHTLAAVEKDEENNVTGNYVCTTCGTVVRTRLDGRSENCGTES